MVIVKGALERLGIVLLFIVLSVAGTILMHHWMFPSGDGFSFWEWLGGFIVGTITFYIGAIVFVALCYGCLSVCRFIIYDTTDTTEIERLKTAKSQKEIEEIQLDAERDRDI